MDSALAMYRRRFGSEPVDPRKLVRCSMTVVAQHEKTLVLRCRLIQELKKRLRR